MKSFDLVLEELFLTHFLGFWYAHVATNLTEAAKLWELMVLLEP